MTCTSHFSATTALLTLLFTCGALACVDYPAHFRVLSMAKGESNRVMFALPHDVELEVHESLPTDANSIDLLMPSNDDQWSVGSVSDDWQTLIALSHVANVESDGFREEGSMQTASASRLSSILTACVGLWSLGERVAAAPLAAGVQKVIAHVPRGTQVRQQAASSAAQALSVVAAANENVASVASGVLAECGSFGVRASVAHDDLSTFVLMLGAVPNAGAVAVRMAGGNVWQIKHNGQFVDAQLRKADTQAADIALYVDTQRSTYHCVIGGKQSVTASFAPGSLDVVSLYTTTQDGASRGADVKLFWMPAENASDDVPANNSPTPSNNSPTPSNNSPTPSNNSPTPSNNSPTPSNNSPTPSNNSPTPSNNSPTPSSSDNVVYAPLPRTEYMRDFWQADLERAVDRTFRVANEQELLDAVKVLVADKQFTEAVEIVHAGGTVSDVNLAPVVGNAFLDYRARGGQLVFRAESQVKVLGKFTIHGIAGVALVGPWNFARVPPATAAKLDTWGANIILNPPTLDKTAHLGLTLDGIKGGAPYVAHEFQFVRQVLLYGFTDLVMRNCDFRNYLEILSADKGARSLIYDNFLLGGIDDAFFVHNRRGLLPRTMYSYVANNVIGPLRNSPRTTLLHPDLLQHTSPNGQADDVYVDDVYFNVILNVDNPNGYPWQFLWPGMGELPQPKRRIVRAYNNIYTCGFRAINIQSEEEVWKFNIATVSPGARNNNTEYLMPLVHSNAHFIGDPARAVVQNNILGREKVEYRIATQNGLRTRDTIVASPKAVDATSPTHMTKVFATTGQQVPIYGFIEDSPPAAQLSSRQAVLDWVSKHRNPVGAGGWNSAAQPGAGFLDPKRFASSPQLKTL